MSIWFISDLHLNHNKDFVYKPRGFDNVIDMNMAIIERWNNTVELDDDIYCLGDLIMGKSEESIEWLKLLAGRIHVIAGNHDTDNRIELYKQCPNIVDVKFADRIKYKKIVFFLSHYPTITTNQQDKPVWCISGHTHSPDIFQEFYMNNYNVACDADNCTPVSIEQIYKEIKERKATE